jgi:hypothetical protein
MNYYDIPFDQIQHRYQVLTPRTEPEPKPAPPKNQPPPIDPSFMWNTIMGKLLRALEPFPEARETYAATLKLLKEQYAGQ